MQNRAILRDVDLLAREHGVDVLPQAGLLRKLDEKPNRFVGDSVLRVVEVETRRLRRQALAALGSSAKSGRRCKLRIFAAMFLQRVPRRPLASAGSVLDGAFVVVIFFLLVQSPFRARCSLTRCESIRSFQDLTKDVRLPSEDRRASARIVHAGIAQIRRAPLRHRRHPPAGLIHCAVIGESSSVSSGMVLTVKGAASALM